MRSAASIIAWSAGWLLAYVSAPRRWEDPVVRSRIDADGGARAEGARAQARHGSPRCHFRRCPQFWSKEQAAAALSY